MLLPDVRLADEPRRRSPSAPAPPAFLTPPPCPATVAPGDESLWKWVLPRPPGRPPRAEPITRIDHFGHTVPSIHHDGAHRHRPPGRRRSPVALVRHARPRRQWPDGGGDAKGAARPRPPPRRATLPRRRRRRRRPGRPGDVGLAASRHRARAAVTAPNIDQALVDEPGHPETLTRGRPKAAPRRTSDSLPGPTYSMR